MDRDPVAHFALSSNSNRQCLILSKAAEIGYGGAVQNSERQHRTTKKQHETDRVQAFSTCGQQIVELHISLIFFCVAPKRS